MRVLVVDDDDVDREKIHRLLKEANFEGEIVDACSVDETFSRLASEHFDCIVADYHLGGQSGLDLLQFCPPELKFTCATIIVTGLGDEEVAAKALRLGANDYLIKDKLDSNTLSKSILNSVHETKLQKKIHDLAHYDSLTGLVSRHLLIDRIRQAIAHSDRKKHFNAISFIDIDNFKAVNDTHGHSAGDAVLVEIARRLMRVIRETDTLSRIGGDEFVLLITELKELKKCKSLIERVIFEVNKPITLKNGIQIQVSASVGVTLIEKSAGIDETLKRADEAMYLAKNSGKNRVNYSDALMETSD